MAKHEGGNGSGIMRGLFAVVFICVAVFVGSILLPVFMPLAKTGATNLKATISTASINSTVDTGIQLFDYGSMLWVLGAGIAIIFVAIALIFVAVKYVKG